MIPSNYHDSDGFKLQFEANCSESDQKFFMQQYPRVDSVVDKRLHCTSCDAHIGTAPARDETVHTHQILAVTQCQTCFMFYVSQVSLSLKAILVLTNLFSRILVNSKKEKMVTSITAGGAVKGVTSSVAAPVASCSAINAFDRIFQKLT